MKSRVLIISTGGTITMLRGADGSLEICEQAADLLKRVPELSQLAEIEVLSLVNVDSSNLQPDLWVMLGRAIHDRLKDFDGIVVTHGTDTLCYTAAALSFFLQELPKPIVLTGSQVPLDDVGSDGRVNLINAVRTATMDVAEVVVVFGSSVIRGTRAKKTSVFDLQAFTSVNSIPLGTIGLSIRFNIHPRRRGKRKHLFMPFLKERVALIPVWPGFQPEILSFLASTHAGVVIEGYGAGHIPTDRNSLVPAITAAVARRVPVVICTQCMMGSTDMELYQVGKAALQAGAIPAMDMTPETALVKLMWVLGQTDDPATIDSLMQKSFVGELHEVE